MSDAGMMKVFFSIFVSIAFIISLNGSEDEATILGVQAFTEPVRGRVMPLCDDTDMNKQLRREEFDFSTKHVKHEECCDAVIFGRFCFAKIVHFWFNKK